jgi:hypothetical protein
MSEPTAVPSPWLTSPEAANYIRKSNSSLAGWRVRKIGPKVQYSGSRPVYNVSDLDAWLRENNSPKKVSPNVGRPRGSKSSKNKPRRKARR